MLWAQSTTEDYIRASSNRQDLQYNAIRYKAVSCTKQQRTALAAQCHLMQCTIPCRATAITYRTWQCSAKYSAHNNTVYATVKSMQCNKMQNSMKPHDKCNAVQYGRMRCKHTTQCNTLLVLRTTIKLMQWNAVQHGRMQHKHTMECNTIFVSYLAFLSTLNH